MIQEILSSAATTAGLFEVRLLPLKMDEVTAKRFTDRLASYKEFLPFLEKTAPTRLLKSEWLVGQTHAIITLLPYPKLFDSPHITPYALFDDYHRQFRQKLLEFQRQLKQHFPSAEFRPFVDSEPVLEKPLALLAGLGFIGRNTLLVNPKYGSRCFIGGLFTNAAFSKPNTLPDSSHSEDAKDSCGSCHRCVKACPTHALTDNGLNVEQCISYQTIENRTTLPDSVSSSMGEKIFGCGECERVCPKNKGIKLPNQPNWPLYTSLASATLEQLLQDASQQFDEVFIGTPLHRLGKRSLIRNILTAMGNSGKKRYIELVEPFLLHASHQQVAEMALKKLRNLS